jgi:membrane protein DedA with SNARE-associated domain
LSELIAYCIDLLHQLATRVPLPLFTAIAAFIEEVIAPIPSPIVMTLAGSLAESAGQPVSYLFLLALVGGISKTFGSWIVYLLADKGEDIILGRFGRFLGISHAEVEAFGSHMSKGRRDGVVIFLLRAIPIIPTAPVSLVAGLVKLELRGYLIYTFWGTLVRNMLYLYFGYTSLGALTAVNEGLDNWETIGYVILALMMAAGIAYFYYLRSRGTGMTMVERITRKKK